MAKITYDPEVKILMIRVNKGKIDDSDMFGDCIVDYDSERNILNIEIMNVELKNLPLLKDEKSHEIELN